MTETDYIEFNKYRYSKSNTGEVAMSVLLDLYPDEGQLKVFPVENVKSASLIGKSHYTERPP